MRIVKTSIVLGAVLLALVSQAPAAEEGAKGAGKPPAKPAAKTEKSAVKTPGGVVAKVNGVGLDQAAFDRNWDYFLQRSGIPAGHSDKDGKVSEFRKQILDRLIDEELLFQEAKKLKYLAAKEAVDAEMAKAHAQFPTPDAFKQALGDKRGIFKEELSRRERIAILRGVLWAAGGIATAVWVFKIMLSPDIAWLFSAWAGFF